MFFSLLLRSQILFDSESYSENPRSRILLTSGRHQELFSAASVFSNKAMQNYPSRSISFIYRKMLSEIKIRVKLRKKCRDPIYMQRWKLLSTVTTHNSNI